jgi:hypothetical protein
LRSDLQITSPSIVADDKGKAFTVTVSGLGAPGTGADTAAIHRTSTVATWAIAHASTRGITSVVVGDQEWRPDRNSWRHPATPAPSGTVVLKISAK